MLKLLIIWFIFSIILTLFSSRLIKRSSKINLDRHKSLEYGDWFVKDTDVQNADWYIKECPHCGKLHSDHQLRTMIIKKMVRN